jgi:deazaflavin-dependent oxidoreductase (nitroreductase family)
MRAPDPDAMEGLTPKQWRFVRKGHRMAQRHPKGGHVFSDLNRVLIRLTAWRVGASIQGVSVGLLTTTGRRSGRPRTVPVVCLDDGSRFLVAASNSGLDSPPAWCLNLRAHPDAEMRTRAGAERVVAHELTGAEREVGWSRLRAYNPVLSGYQACTQRQIALFAFERPSRSASR